MIHNFHKKIILLGFLIIFTIIIIQFNISFNLVTCVSLVTFTSFIFIIYRSINYEDDYYTPTRLFYTVTIYSFFLLALYLWLSWYLEGDTYIFSKKDAMLYELVSMKIKDLSYRDGFYYIKNNFDFDDWGAFILMSSILKIIPHKIFLNFSYVIFGGFTSVVLFKTGIRIMSKQSSYLAAAAFTMSSYNIFFYGSFLKETGFILLIALLFNSLYKYIIYKNSFSIIYFILYSVLICFFRPATTVFIWFSITAYYIFKKGESIGKMVIISIFGVVSLNMIGYMENIFNRYTLYGNIDRLLDSKESTGLPKNLTYIINFFASLFGPFPTLIGTDRPLTCLYGSGLLYKFFMNFPFWLAAWKIIKNKIVYLYPMLFFIIIETLSVAFVQKGFELRLTLPHIALFYMISFWYFDEIGSNEKVQFHRYSFLFFIITFLVICGWGLLRS